MLPRVVTSLAAILLLLATTATTEVDAQVVTRDVVLYVDPAPNPWAQSHLAEKLKLQLSRDSRVRLTTVVAGDASQPPFPQARHDLDSLVNWGAEVGGRYLVTIVVKDQGIERRKSMQVPLIFHRWETVAFVTGEVHVVDLTRGKLLYAESFEETMPVKRAFQLTPDDDPYDPDLHLRAIEKVRIFNRLEEKLADQLVTTVRSHAWRR